MGFEDSFLLGTGVSLISGPILQTKYMEEGLPIEEPPGSHTQLSLEFQHGAWGFQFYFN